MGQSAKYSSRVDVFRFASKLRRSSMRSALRICAMNRRGQPNSRIFSRIWEKVAVLHLTGQDCCRQAALLRL